MIEHRHVYISTPRWAKVADRGLRALSYYALSFTGLHQLVGRHPLFEENSFTASWTGFLALVLLAASMVAGTAALTGKAQVEYVSLPLLLGVVGARLVLGLSAVGVSPVVALMLALWFLMAARYVWIHVAVTRARMIKRTAVTVLAPEED